MTELEKLQKEYFETFGEFYGVNWGESLTENEQMAEIRKCLKDGKPKSEPEYEPDCFY